MAAWQDPNQSGSSRRISHCCPLPIWRGYVGHRNFQNERLAGIGHFFKARGRLGDKGQFHSLQGDVQPPQILAVNDDFMGAKNSFQTLFRLPGEQFGKHELIIGQGQ